MKSNIHPAHYRPVVFQDSNNGTLFLIQSCVKTAETIKYEDGKEYPLFKIEISSASHPFYTGKKMTVDTAGRIEKFKEQRKLAGQKQQEEDTRAKKERKRNSFEDKVNIELEKQRAAEQKKEEKLMAKIKKSSGSRTKKKAPEAIEPENPVDATAPAA